MLLGNGEKYQLICRPWSQDKYKSNRNENILYERDILCRTHFNQLDWNEIYLVMVQLTHLYRIWKVKHVSGFSKVNDVRFNWE